MTGGGGWKWGERNAPGSPSLAGLPRPGADGSEEGRAHPLRNPDTMGKPTKLAVPKGRWLCPACTTPQTDPAHSPGTKTFAEHTKHRPKRRQRGRPEASAALHCTTGPFEQANAAKTADRLTFRVALSGPLKKQFEEALEKEHNHLFQPQSDGIPCVEVIRWEEKPTDRRFAKLHRRRQGEGGRRRHDHGEDRENTQPRWESAKTRGARTVPRARGCCETSGRREACHAGLYSSHWKTASVKIPQTVSGGQNRQGWKQGAQERTPWPRTRPRRLPAI